MSIRDLHNAKLSAMKETGKEITGRPELPTKTKVDKPKLVPPPPSNGPKKPKL